MKKIVFLAGMVLPVLSYTQTTDSSHGKTLITTAPRLGGITVSNLVAPVSYNGNNFTIQQPVVDIGVPLYKKFKTAHPIFIKAGIRYQGLFLSNEQSIGSTNFYAVSIPLSFTYLWSRAANITFIAIPTVASDFKQSITTQDVLYTAGIRIGFRQNKSLRYGVTLTYLSNYSGKFLIPVPDIDWVINSRLSLSAIVPARMLLKYKITKAQSLGITGGLNSSMYALNSGDKKQYLQWQQVSGGLLYDVTAGKRWKINLIAGHTFSQRLQTFNINEQVPFNGFGKLNSRATNVSYRQNSFIFQGGISYQF